MTFASRKLAELYKEKIMTDRPINKQLQAEIERFESYLKASTIDELKKRDGEGEEKGAREGKAGFLEFSTD